MRITIFDKYTEKYKHVTVPVSDDDALYMWDIEVWVDDNYPGWELVSVFPKKREGN